MCGILGGINTGFGSAHLERLRHRGPDQQSLVTEPIGDGLTLTLGQTRLAVVDRHPIALPVRVRARDGRQASILFNGEIYNWPELRVELETLGWSFATSTDTEVALVAYLEWGADSLERFNGMFALAIWDGDVLFCARDRLGQKPLFYRARGRSLEIASEVKAFDDLEFVGSELHDLFEFCHDGDTLYRDVEQLCPGHYLTFDPRRGALRTTRYWDIPSRLEPLVRDERQAVAELVELLGDAVRLRMRADVPVTLLLSGGIDSSLLCRLSGVKHAFTCQFAELGDTIDEESYARDLAERLGVELTVVRPTREQFLADLPAMARHLEMPTGSFSVFPLYRLAHACRDAGYKVVLSGEGSDELFAGYVRNELLLGDLEADDPRARTYSSMLARYRGSDLDRFCRMASRSGLGGAAMMKGYLAQLWSHHKSLLQNMSYVETRVFLQPLLQMADRMSMAHGLETRNPFLDHRVVAFAFGLADSLRHRDGRGKWLVHEVARLLLPRGAKVLDREVKHGLPTPVNQWLQGRPSFDRRYWNAILTAECIKALPGTR